MLRRTKMLVAGYCVGGLVILALAIGIILQMTNWLRHPEQFGKFGHHHEHEEEEPRPPESSPAETYTRDGKTYLKSPFLKRDFDVTGSSVNVREILHVKLDPGSFLELEEFSFISVGQSGLPDGDGVLGTMIGGDERAYPIRMLNYHIVLNDICGGEQIAVVWDPLSMTPKVFDRTIERGDGSRATLAFGTLGLLYKGGLLLYDETTESIWWPPEGKCVAGNLNGTVLKDHPFLLVSWKVWRDRHPGTSVLSTDTPFAQKYPRNLYDAYYPRRELPLPVEGWDEKESPFKWSVPVLALEAEGKAKAYPLSALARAQGDVEDRFAGTRVVIRKPSVGPPYLTDEQDREIRYCFGAWFLWSVRYADIEVWESQEQPTE